MKIAALISRVLLGLLFVVFGLNALFFFIPGSRTPLPGLAGQFVGALVASHYESAIGIFEIAGGLLLLTGFYVPLGLVFLGPILVNILLFHLFLMPATIGPGIVVTLLWFVVFFRNRQHFAGIFVSRTS